MLDHYLDLEAMRQRIAERITSDLALSREAVEQGRTEVERSEARLARIQRGWQDGVLDDDDYRQQRDRVLGELEAAGAAVERAERQAELVERQGAITDAEWQLLAQLASVKAAVAKVLVRRRTCLPSETRSASCSRASSFAASPRGRSGPGRSRRATSPATVRTLSWTKRPAPPTR